MKKTTQPHEFPSEACYIDSHCHLDMEAYQPDLEQVIQRAAEANICNIITIGIDVPSSKKAVELACKYPHIFATIGIHPHDVENTNEQSYYTLENLFKNAPGQVKAYGEIGLDYCKNYSPRAIQQQHFAIQLELAQKLRIPVIIHNRDASEDCYDMLRGFPLKDGGVMHCFSGSYPFAKKILDLGMLISFSGVITFKNAVKILEVAKKIPLDRMLVETDGPFLTPEPYRGKRNEPAHVRYTTARIAELRGVTIEEVARKTTENAKKIFNLP